VTATVRQRASDAPDPFFATTLARGLAVLDAFRDGEAALSNAELAARTGLSRPTVSRLVNTLLTLGYLKRNALGRFRLGTRVLGIAYPLLAGFRVRQLARPMMREFAEQAGGAVSIGIADGANLVYLETARSSQSFPHVPEVGFSVPLISTGIGRAAMSLMEEAELTATLARIEREQPEGYRRARRNALAGIEACRAHGACAALGEWRPEILAVAAPLVRTPEDECLAINCGIPAWRVSPEAVREEWVPRMASLARSIRTMLEREPA
jgi:DNA-binding IclR family transcriptional regulator